MRDKLHIALDFDDVICDFVGGVCETISRDFDVDVRPEHITDWNFGQFLDEHLGRDWWSWMRDHADLWGEKFRPVPGALGGIEELRRQGHHLEIVTSKPAWAEAATWRWMGKYHPSVHQVTIVGLGSDHKSPPKSEMTVADVLVDDRWENCLDFLDDGRQAVLMTRAHNLSRDAGASGLIRAQDWSDVLRALELESEGLL